MTNVNSHHRHLFLRRHFLPAPTRKALHPIWLLRHLHGHKSTPLPLSIPPAFIHVRPTPHDLIFIITPQILFIYTVSDPAAELGSAFPLPRRPSGLDPAPSPPFSPLHRLRFSHYTSKKRERGFALNKYYLKPQGGVDFVLQQGDPAGSPKPFNRFGPLVARRHASAATRRAARTRASAHTPTLSALARGSFCC